MKKYDAITIIALLVLVTVLPFYALQESARMEQASSGLHQQYVREGVSMYVENCASCHGVNGEGVGAMPALNSASLAAASPELLYNVIAHSPHGTAMSAWHVAEGGSLSDYQVEGLVTLIRQRNWEQVETLVTSTGVTVETLPSLEQQIAVVAMQGEWDPHDCAACHKEPNVHADRFGTDCARCHTLQAWRPAQLTRHTFSLEHGDEGEMACQSCHLYSYVSYTCYGCHDHQPQGMLEVHAEEGIDEFENCAVCHPTGAPGEGDQFRADYLPGSEHSTPYQQAPAGSADKETVVRPVAPNAAAASPAMAPATVGSIESGSNAHNDTGYRHSD